ncbi:MAG: HAD family phosphatase [Lachnospiraceae bacterium]|nr:HAD family phosphatase [Lachnospiraceae bacterium]
MWRDKKGAIFDMDGTLMDSMWIWRDIDIEYLGRFGIALPEDLQAKIEGLSFAETAVYFQEHFGITDSLEKIQSDWNDMAIDFYRHRIGMKRGARELLTQMKERGMKIGIATSNSVELTEECLAANGVADLFDTVRTSRDTPRGKPFPDIYLSVADEWGIAPDDLIVFEDIPNGAIAGKRAGMEVIAVADDYALPRREELIRIADHFIEDFTQIL